MFLNIFCTLNTFLFELLLIVILKAALSHRSESSCQVSQANGGSVDLEIRLFCRSRRCLRLITLSSALHGWSPRSSRGICYNNRSVCRALGKRTSCTLWREVSREALVARGAQTFHARTQACSSGWRVYQRGPLRRHSKANGHHLSSENLVLCFSVDVNLVRIFKLPLLQVAHQHFVNFHWKWPKKQTKPRYNFESTMTQITIKWTLKRFNDGLRSWKRKVSPVVVRTQWRHISPGRGCREPSAFESVLDKTETSKGNHLKWTKVVSTWPLSRF